jgi:hypothetical protein
VNLIVAIGLIVLIGGIPLAAVVGALWWVLSGCPQPIEPIPKRMNVEHLKKKD